LNPRHRWALWPAERAVVTKCATYYFELFVIIVCVRAHRGYA